MTAPADQDTTIYTIRLRSRGQVTVPRAVRDRLDVAEGDVLTLIQVGDVALFTPRQPQVPRLADEIADMMEAEGVTLAEIGLFGLVLSRQVLDECERNLRIKLPRALSTFAELLTRVKPDVRSDPPAEETARWKNVIAAKDAPILAAAVLADPDRLLSLDVRDFTAEVAARSGLGAV